MYVQICKERYLEIVKKFPHHVFYYTDSSVKHKERDQIFRHHIYSQIHRNPTLCPNHISKSVKKFLPKHHEPFSLSQITSRFSYEKSHCPTHPNYQTYSLTIPYSCHLYLDSHEHTHSKQQLC